MNRSRFFELAKWPLLLIVAAAGLWFFGDLLDPRRTIPGEGGDRGPGGPGAAEDVSAPDRLTAPGEGIALDIAADSSRVLVTGLSDEALRYLRGRSGELSGVVNVYALPDDREWDPSMLPVDGTWSVSGEAIRFDARHAWLPQVRYLVRLDLNRLNELLGVGPGGEEGDVEMAGTRGETGQGGGEAGPGAGVSAASGIRDTTVVISRPEGLRPERVAGFHPSADTLPQNLLKFYVQFSGPMSRGQAADHITIRDADGNVVPDAFLELPQELWDPDVTRLTILFDPGRIKRGLERRNLMGVPFEPGKRYSLVVDAAMEDGNGLPLGESYRKNFVISPPDRKMPDHEQWRIDPPEPGTRGPLRIHLDEPIDHALLLRLISVYLDDGGGAGATGEGTHIPGTAGTRNEERVWTFTPDEPWDKGNYFLEIGRVLEDLAGNNLISVFDVDLAEGADDPVNPAVPTARTGAESQAGSVVVKQFKIIGE